MGDHAFEAIVMRLLLWMNKLRWSHRKAGGGVIDEQLWFNMLTVLFVRVLENKSTVVYWPSLDKDHKEAFVLLCNQTQLLSALFSCLLNEGVFPLILPSKRFYAGTMQGIKSIKIDRKGQTLCNLVAIK